MAGAAMQDPERKLRSNQHRVPKSIVKTVGDALTRMDEAHDLPHIAFENTISDRLREYFGVKGIKDISMEQLAEKHWGSFCPHVTPGLAKTRFDADYGEAAAT